MLSLDEISLISRKTVSSALVDVQNREFLVKTEKITFSITCIAYHIMEAGLRW